MPAQVTIIIVNWNGCEDTLDCLSSLRALTYPAARVIVVDNGSCDGSIDAIMSKFPEVKVIASGRNLGFTGGNNLGIEHALEDSPEFIFLLNNDTVIEPDALDALVLVAQQNPRLGLVTPVIYYYDKPSVPWFAGATIDLKRGVAVHENNQVPARSEPIREIPWASGCAMLIRTDVIKAVGGFDDRYFLNWEDVDLCLRVRALGHMIAIVPAAVIYHKVGRSFGKASAAGNYYYSRNRLLLVRLHCGARYPLTAMRVIAGQLRRGLGEMVMGRSSHQLRISLRATADHLLRRHGRISLPLPL